MSRTKTKFRFAIDRGGTFTDVYASIHPVDGPPKFRVMKLLSSDPSNYRDAPTEAIRRILEEETGVEHPKGEVLPSDQLEWVRMGTTVATNALLERDGEPLAFVTTKGLHDVLHIGNQSRPKIFDLEIKRPELLYKEVVEIDERVLPHTDTMGEIELAALKTSWSRNAYHRSDVEHPDEDQKDEDPKDSPDSVDMGDDGAEPPSVIGITGERVYILRKPDEAEVHRQLQEVYDSGIRALAICLMHSYTYPEHEAFVARIAKEIGFTHVTESSKIMPMVKLVPRGFTACADAYLSPCVHRYLHHFIKGFDEEFLRRVNLLFMQSDGGLADAQSFSGYRAVLSGPAAGVVGYAQTTPITEDAPAIIGFDMGGTSTDVSRVAAGGEYEHTFENETAGVAIRAPQLDIITVAAGGGSVLNFQSGLFHVGPKSAGAFPGPACYRNDGPLAVTDANLVLGRLDPGCFPPIFGPDHDEPIDIEASKRKFTELTAEINAFHAESSQPPITMEQVALGFLRVANESMCRPIRQLTQARGHDTSTHVLSCFGGAGGQHATAVARALGIRRVHLHRFSGILSAIGLGLADVVEDVQEPCAKFYSKETLPFLKQRLAVLREQAEQTLLQKGFSEDLIFSTEYLNMRYKGTETSIMISLSEESSDYQKEFFERYQKEYGFLLDRPVLVDDVRVRTVGKVSRLQALEIQSAPEGDVPKPFKTVQTFFGRLSRPDGTVSEEGWHETKLYRLTELLANHVIPGPAVIIDQTSTILIDPGSVATISKTGDVEIEVVGSGGVAVTEALDSIQLTLFGHRFMSIAEQMGRTLQRTSISTNIKERLDFSCAIFGPDGGLVANAPHVPVHLGAMQEAVKFQLQTRGESWKDGEVIVSNHPHAGGSHLPDITVITPVFEEGKIVFFVASRGHHSDIGGISPGSMPPFSKRLYEEGAAIKSFLLVKDGIFDEEGITELLTTSRGRDDRGFPIPGTRNLSDNLSDMKAQVAANHQGITLMKKLISHYGLKVVQAYMYHIQDAAEIAVREMLKDLSISHKLPPIADLEAVDYMDDGTPIKLKLTVNREDGTAVFDFSGTGLQVYGNINAPPAVTFSAIIYALRCLVKRDIPLNQGCMAPIRVRIPKGSLLNPTEDVGVVGGNVLTSQRVTDVVLKAFRASAASQGCMNNLTFGDESFGYYETIAGGAGAGRTWAGQSGVHTHMTNTRITDPEILERRYPVQLRQFSLREGSGGAGRFPGGEGVARDIQALRKLEFGILSERRTFRPYGLEGGSPGQPGQNSILRMDGIRLSVGGKNAFRANPGDRFVIMTPGGGGYGKPEAENAIE